MEPRNTASPAKANLSNDEAARFGALADQWWDARGPMRALHAMNPLRVAWIAGRLPSVPTGRILDIGCGAGLAAEALARAGHAVLGVDAAGAAVLTARRHAEGAGLDLSYRHATAEALIGETERFGAVVSLEVIEHIPDPAKFLFHLAMLRQPGAPVFVSTLNRTLASLALAKIGAEYVMRLLPRGTHRWRDFITPAELETMARRAGMSLRDMTGMAYDPGRNQWHETRSPSVNYIVKLG